MKATLAKYFTKHTTMNSNEKINFYFPKNSLSDAEKNKLIEWLMNLWYEGIKQNIIKQEQYILSKGKGKLPEPKWLYSN